MTTRGHSVDTRLGFVRTVLEIYQARIEREGVMALDRSLSRSLADAEAIFKKAGLDLGSFADPEVKPRGCPPRDQWVVLREQWIKDPHGRCGTWRAAATWDKATRRARVTSRKAIRGRKGPDGSRLDAFNARPINDPSGDLSYSPTRLYVCDEGVTWRWE